jgi:hypothetical protein
MPYKPNASLHALVSDRNLVTNIVYISRQYEYEYTTSTDLLFSHSAPRQLIHSQTPCTQLLFTLHLPCPALSLIPLAGTVFPTRRHPARPLRQVGWARAGLFTLTRHLYAQPATRLGSQRPGLVRGLHVPAQIQGLEKSHVAAQPLVVLRKRILRLWVGLPYVQEVPG